MNKKIYTLFLGVQPELSLAEIHSIFPGIQVKTNENLTQAFIGIKNISEKKLLEKLPKMWGVSMVTKEIISGARLSKLSEIISDDLEKKYQEKKISFGIQAPKWVKTLKMCLEIKKILKKKDISSRFINKNDSPLATALIHKEKLISLETGYVLSSEKNIFSLSQIFFLQDIDLYTKKDMEKNRDMKVGMLPPKLAQMLVNFSTQWDTLKNIWDPFCGMGTILIEGAYSKYSMLYGSDIEPENTSRTEKNISPLTKKYKVEVIDARSLEKNNFPKENTCIVTEWYLGKMFFPGNIWREAIKHEKKILLPLYEDFLMGLVKIQWKERITFCVPFWKNSETEKIFLQEIFPLIEKYFTIITKDFSKDTTERKSLLYERKNQLVGREIYTVKVKNA